MSGQDDANGLKRMDPKNLMRSYNALTRRVILRLANEKDMGDWNAHMDEIVRRLEAGTIVNVEVNDKDMDAMTHEELVNSLVALTQVVFGVNPDRKDMGRWSVIRQGILRRMKAGGNAK